MSDELRDALRKSREAQEELERLHTGLGLGDNYPDGIEVATKEAQDAWDDYLSERRRLWGV